MDSSICKAMASVYQKANTDKQFREKLLENPIEILSQYDITICDPKRLVIEYHDDYGIFIGLPTEIDSKEGLKEQVKTSDNFNHHSLNDCLHH
ncbi:hypothetical protein L3V83_09555 [Thiotrichales bacterium 19X7-9]|nr:hypothetical protein [Thiotrichales bacterium 19X7-9]